MRRPENWSEALANPRRIARENPRVMLSLALIPARIGLMIAVIRACTGASGAASFAALVSAALAWVAVEIGVRWATKDPDDGTPGKIGAECESEERRSFSVICDGGDPDLQILIDECPGDNCQTQGGACIAGVIMKINGIEIGRGPWFELRMTEAAQEFLRRGGGTAERMMRIADRNLGVRQPRNDAEIN